MIDRQIYKLFKDGSKTYFYSSIFFPEKTRKDVFSLYAFVRKADNFIDKVPSDQEGYFSFKKNYLDALSGKKSTDIVVTSFVEMSKRKKMNSEWITAFFASMEMDLTKKEYKNIDEVNDYIYGSAEVVGLMMSVVMSLSKESSYNARMLGKAMQYINFIRDIREDIELGRCYFPKDELAEYGIEMLNEENAMKNEHQFCRFINVQIDRYISWQREAEKGYRYIPKLFLIPVRTAAEMYRWTAWKIRKNPMLVFKKKIKPPIYFIMLRALVNALKFR